MDDNQETPYDITNNYGGVILMTDQIREITDEYIEKLKTTDEMIKYSNAANMINKMPDLVSELEEYRKENFDIQNQYEGDELFDKQDELQEKYKHLLEDSRAASFLHAEAGFCRMVQEIYVRLMEGLEFQ